MTAYIGQCPPEHYKRVRISDSRDYAKATVNIYVCGHSCCLREAFLTVSDMTSRAPLVCPLPPVL